MKKLSFVFLVLLLFNWIGFGKEGMWIPLFLEKYNLDEMQSMGFRLTASDIYDINHASMKDAVVIFGSGCTGELISGDGLLLTNHHCGYKAIQSHSNVDNDLLTDGFWAMSRTDELPNPGLTVRFLDSMEEVTDRVFDGTNGLDSVARAKEIQKNIAEIQREVTNKGAFTAQVKPLFYGNQYFLYVYKTYRDVRLVGAPPSAIGKFGGDTDNWMWPRHTGDFSLFRIYADSSNEPADYSPDNVPYKPKQYFPISMQGVKEGDFTLVLGNPGTTMQYIPSHEVDFIQNERNPYRISLRDKKLEIMRNAMNASPKIRIQYAAKYASVSNAWKKWQGEILGLRRIDAVNQKRVFESEFEASAKKAGTWEKSYRPVFENFDSLYPVYRRHIRASDYYNEIVFHGIEIFQLASRINDLMVAIENRQEDRVKRQMKEIEDFIPSFFKDFNPEVDAALFKSLLPLLAEDISTSFLPDYFSDLNHRWGGRKMVKKVYERSILTHRDQFVKLLERGETNALLSLRRDPIVKLFHHLNFSYKTVIEPELSKLSRRINQNMHLYMAGIMANQGDEPPYPDANFTLRVTYGKVGGYTPLDGVRYKHYTTLDGIMEKDNPDIYDYRVPERLKELYRSADYGPYASHGSVPVCFIASNHTTGGNSGSPVIDANGRLIGINFDRSWDGVMSDIIYDPDRSRNIAVDIRYVLFIIDKFAGAGYLLEEMDIEKDSVKR